MSNWKEVALKALEEAKCEEKKKEVIQAQERRDALSRLLKEILGINVYPDSDKIKLDGVIFGVEQYYGSTFFSFGGKTTSGYYLVIVDKCKVCGNEIRTPSLRNAAMVGAVLEWLSREDRSEDDSPFQVCSKCDDEENKSYKSEEQQILEAIQELTNLVRPALTPKTVNTTVKG
jgi:hypothetical protein